MQSFAILGVCLVTELIRDIYFKFFDPIRDLYIKCAKEFIDSSDNITLLTTALSFFRAQRVVDFIKLHEKVQQRVKEAQIKCA